MGDAFGISPQNYAGNFRADKSRGSFLRGKSTKIRLLRWISVSLFLPMALIVQKYGGTSVGSPERIKNVARRVAHWKARGHELVVVVSAMSGETNRLIGL